MNGNHAEKLSLGDGSLLAAPGDGWLYFLDSMSDSTNSFFSTLFRLSEDGFEKQELYHFDGRMAAWVTSKKIFFLQGSSDTWYKAPTLTLHMIDTDGRNHQVLDEVKCYGRWIQYEDDAIYYLDYEKYEIGEGKIMKYDLVRQEKSIALSPFYGGSSYLQIRNQKAYYIESHAAISYDPYTTKAMIVIADLSTGETTYWDMGEEENTSKTWSIFPLSIQENDLFYFQNQQKFLCKMQKGMAPQVLLEKAISHYAIVNHRIYYRLEEDYSHWYVMDTDGNEEGILR